jgi:hypothetical protein
MPDIRWTRLLGSLLVMSAVLVVGSLGAALMIVPEWWSLAFVVSHMPTSAVGVYIIASLWPQRPWVRHLVFWVVFLAWVGMFIPVAFFSPPGGAADGADQLARMILPIIAAGALLPYALDQWLGICDPQRLTRRPGNVCPSCGYPIGVSSVCTECGCSLPRAAGRSMTRLENSS